MIRSESNTSLKNELEVIAIFAKVLAIIIFLFLYNLYEKNVLDTIVMEVGNYFGNVFSAHAGIFLFQKEQL